MVKAVDREMIIEQVRLTEKSGGASGYWNRPEDGRQDQETPNDDHRA
jgi:hypothetical protein